MLPKQGYHHLLKLPWGHKQGGLLLKPRPLGTSGYASGHLRQLCVDFCLWPKAALVRERRSETARPGHGDLDSNNV